MLHMRVCCGSYDALQGAGNRDYCAVAMVSPSGIRVGVAGGLLVCAASVFTLVTGR